MPTINDERKKRGNKSGEIVSQGPRSESVVRDERRTRNQSAIHMMYAAKRREARIVGFDGGGVKKRFFLKRLATIATMNGIQSKMMITIEERRAII